MRCVLTPRSGGKCLVAAAALLLPACGGDDIPMQKTVAVTGRVLVDGQPVEGVDVRFIPVDKANFKLQETPLGRTDKDGRFTPTTYYSNDGAPKGEYLVAIAVADQIPEDPEADETQAAVAANKARKAKAPSKVPPLYQVPQKSGLTVTVDRPGELPPFELSSQAKAGK